MGKKALISVWDKDNAVEFAEFLQDKGYEILSTGSTGKLLKDNGIDVTFIEEYTKSKEMFGGRVKTLHPMVHGGILYVRGNKDHEKTAQEFNIDPIDIVVVNLYPFEATALRTDDSDELIENIDIGGPAMLRSAAKNFKSVLVVSEVKDYKEVMDKFDDIDEEFRKRYALKAFAKTAYYDSLIIEKFKLKSAYELGIPLKHIQNLRYGENPAQSAKFYKNPLNIGIADAEQLHGKELSYNNILDIDVVYRMIIEFDKTACVIVKHNTPCGAAVGKDVTDAYEKALSCDPISAFGGIIGINGSVNIELAKKISGRFYEVVVAFDFEEKALEILKSKKNIRLIKVKKIKPYKFNEIRSVLGGYLVQENDLDGKFLYKVVSKSKPTENQITDLEFASKIVKFVKSNAIVYAKDGKTLAIGAGQTSRIDSAKFAAIRAKELNIDLIGSVMASDGFFPFRDSIDFAHSIGVEAVVEPGGSIRDKEVIEAADEFSIPLIFTGTRHFRH